MIGWLNPAALAGLTLLTLPVLIHLLRTQRAERVQFPSLRFVRTSRTAAVRFRLPTDLLLLAVRLAIALAAVLAAAQPVFLTGRRLDEWNARSVRAVVVDRATTSADAKAAADASAAAAAESSSAYRSIRIAESGRLGDAVNRAVAWLAAAPPARREVVVISAFRLDSIRASDLASIPDDIGVRLVQVGGQVTSREVTGLTTLSAPRAVGHTQKITLEGPRTRVTLSPASADIAGLRIVGAAAPEIESLLRAVAIAGAPAASAEQPIVLAFGEQPGIRLAPPAAGTPRWMVPVVLRLEQDEALQRSAHNESAAAAAGAAPWTTVASDRNGKPIVRAGWSGQELVVDVAAEPRSFLAAVSLQAVLNARAGTSSHEAQEILRMPGDRLAAWSRPPGGVGRDGWRRVDRPDSRWLWLAVLALLAVERYLRRPLVQHEAEVRRVA
jgi:hypothetical protein